MSNLVTLDPVTQRQVLIRATDNYHKVINRIVAEMGEEIFCTMGWEEIAQLFFYQGFTNGAIATVADDEFRDTVALMVDEIEYQKKIISSRARQGTGIGRAHPLLGLRSPKGQIKRRINPRFYVTFICAGNPRPTQSIGFEVVFIFTTCD